MTMIDVLMANVTHTQNEISVSGEWILGILFGVIITFELWYIFFIGFEMGKENKLIV